MKCEVFGYLGVKINSSEISNGRGLCQKFRLLQNREKNTEFYQNRCAVETALSFSMFKRARGGKKIVFGKTQLEDFRKKNLW